MEERGEGGTWARKRSCGFFLCDGSMATSSPPGEDEGKLTTRMVSSDLMP